MDSKLTLISALIAVGIPIAAYILGKKMAPGASNEEMANLREQSRELEDKLIEVLSEKDRFASKAQIATLMRQTESFLTTIAEQRSLLETISQRLEKARIDVEERELAQQEARAMREEDEVIIAQVTNNYSLFSTESVTLEHTLAESLKTLDAMTTELQMTPDQQAVFSELSNALTSASAQLRDVIVDYQNAHERLENLRSQHKDLEAEYSKLVEQQLGG
jgi:septation ring formation regulator EzrA